MRLRLLLLVANIAMAVGGPCAPAEAQRAPVQSAAREQERTSMLRYCSHVDSISASTATGIRERSDCWKRIQLEGMGNALVDERYLAAVRDYDALVAADSLRRAATERDAQVDRQLREVQSAVMARALSTADSTVKLVLAAQPENQRALAFQERIVTLRRADQLRRALYLLAGVVLLGALALGVIARVVAVRQKRAASAEQLKAAQRTAMVRIIDGVGRGKMYTLEGPLFRIGSAESDRPEEKNDLVLSDDAAFVSRYHCVILRRDGHFYLIDSSLNGTYVDNTAVERGQPTLLQDGSEFTLSGVTRLKFLLV